ncbi:U32 family peptidase [Elusimicrobiota bacterium]
MNKPELVAPAGNLEKLKIALNYGADSVYLAGKEFGLRAAADNFTLDEMKQGIDYAHNMGKKVYAAVNIIPHNSDLTELDQYITALNNIKVDAIIVADPGILTVVKENAPDMPVTLSTQANNTNYKSALFWHSAGINKITAARELSLEELKTIVDNTPAQLDIEVFIHGSICISYSGRCLLSSYMTGRDSNKGSCAHPCRWKYSLTEERRQGEYFQVYEDEKSTHIFNSKDLCTIEIIPELIQSGVTSFKIEGRMKNSHYVAVTAYIYRKAIDRYISDPQNYKMEPSWLNELEKTTHRSYTKGFLMDKPGPDEYNYQDSAYIKNYEFSGLVLDYDPDSRTARVEQRNKIVLGDSVEIVGPQRKYYSQTIREMRDEDGNNIETAPHARQIVYIQMDDPVEPLDIIRKEMSDQ